MKKRDRQRRLGKLVFVLPVLAVVALVLAAVFLVPTQGTLDVYTLSSDKYTGTLSLSVDATVGSSTLRTPFNLTLSPGIYSVVFPQLSYYTTPPSRQVAVVAGKTTDAAGVYAPIVVSISVTQDGFNATSVRALHGVTPVIWKDVSSSPVTLSIDPAGRVNLNPGQNFTYVFQSAGKFAFQLYFSPAAGGLVQVA